MEDKLKEVIQIALEARLGSPVKITLAEWNAAKVETLNDIYCNRVCSLKATSLGYFISTMVTTLAIIKRITA